MSSNAYLIDEYGKAVSVHRDPSAALDLSLDEYCRTGQSPVCFGAGMSWHRSVFDYFGPLHPTVRNSDMLIPFRGMLLGTVFYDPIALVRWRQHAGNMTLSKKIRESTSESERLQAEERRLNNWVANRYGMLADLKLHVSRVGRSNGLDTVRTALLNQLMLLLDEWLLLRTRMAHLRIGLV